METNGDNSSINITPVAEFKLIIIGDERVGKTTFASKPLLGTQERRELGLEVTAVNFHTIHGPIKLDLWDVSTKETSKEIREGYYTGCDCAIIMFDVCSTISYDNVPKWHKELEKICDNVPMCLVGNKVDVKKRELKARDITYHTKKHMKYFETSAKSNYHLEEPFIWLIKKLLGDPHFKPTVKLELKPAELIMDPDQIAEIEEELAKAEADDQYPKTGLGI